MSPEARMLKVLLAIRNPPEELLTVLKGQQLDTLPEGESLPGYVAKNNYHLILLDGGVESIPSIKAADPRAEIILFKKGEEDFIEAVRHGASACFTVPVETERLREAVVRIQDMAEMRRETAELERLLSSKYTFAGIIGKNPQMLDIFSFIAHIAPYYRTVTIMGETGSGKEVIAKAIHALSPAAKNPFIVCNCGGFVEDLIESELFGHKKGSFTGAVTDKVGLFEAAGEGTIFLDEIGELPLSFQPHFLRVLENGEFKKVGSNQMSKARCRVIAATNRDLRTKVKEGRFREDLFFRLTRLTVEVPPLRDRKDDILLLSRHLLDRFNERSGKRIFGISRPAQSALMRHNWPGNVRELENVIEEAAILTTESFIRLQDLPSYIRESGNSESPLLMSLSEMEKRHIQTVLQQCGNNRTRAAEVLGISRRALLRRIEKFGMR